MDFGRRIVTVRHRVSRVRSKGLLVWDRAKMDSGVRTIPLLAVLIPHLRVCHPGQFEDYIANCRRWTSLAYPDGPATGFVFSREIGTPVEPRNLYRYFDSVRKRIGWDKQTFHRLRHGCAGLLLAQGAPLRAVSKIVGHSGMQITVNIYGHLAEQVSRGAMDHMDRPLATVV